MPRRRVYAAKASPDHVIAEEEDNISGGCCYTIATFHY